MTDDKTKTTDTEDTKEKSKAESFDEMFAEPEKKKKHSVLSKVIISVIAVCFCLYAIADIIAQQAEIAQLKKETEEISRQITIAKQLNDEYERLLDTDEEEYMQKVAVEELGYAYPNERRFYIVSETEN